MDSKKLGLFCSLFKGKEFIEGYLENILNQTYFNKTNFYILDCASPEGEYDIISKYISQYKNIKYKRLDQDPGLYAAWNLCIDWGSEPYIGNWNVDDRKTPWSSEVLMNYLLNDKSLDLVYGKTLISTVPNETWDKTPAQYVYPCLPHSFDNLLKHNSPHCMPIWKKDLHARYGYFNESYLTASDTDMWLRSCQGGAKMKFVDSVVGLYYNNPKGRSTNPETFKQRSDEIKEVKSKFL